MKTRDNVQEQLDGVDPYGGTWSFNSMNEPNLDGVVTGAPEILSAGTANSVSWNPDAIDVTVNPNKRRRITTENEFSNAARGLSTTTEKRTETMTKSVQSDVKTQVLQSDDYKKWLEMKNSFLFQPASVTISTITPQKTTTASPGQDQLIFGGNQAPELEIQHEMNHFPSFPTVEVPTKRIPREFLTNHDNGGQSYQQQQQMKSTTANPRYFSSTPTTDTFHVLPSGTERMSTEDPPIIMTLPPDLIEGIPDGYELVPVDRITDEYEIVPWKQVKTLLNISIQSDIPEKRQVTPVPYPSTTYGPPISPYKEAGYSKDHYLPGLHHDYHEAINEVVKDYYSPPISPDLPELPTLYYDDLGGIKHHPKPKLPGLVLPHDPVAPPKSIKGLNVYDPRKDPHSLHKHAGTNVIHFGSDFGPHHVKDHQINGYKVSTLPPPVPPFIKNIFHTSTTPYPLWNAPSTTPKPVYYSTSTTPYSKVKYSTPHPTTVKSLHSPTPYTPTPPPYTPTPPPYSPTPPPYSPTPPPYSPMPPPYSPTPTTIHPTKSHYPPPVHHKPHRTPHAIKELPSVHFTPEPTNIEYGAHSTTAPVIHQDSKSYSLFNFYTTPSPVYVPEEHHHEEHHHTTVKPYHPPHIPEPHHHPPEPHHKEPHVHHEPYHPPKVHELHPPHQIPEKLPHIPHPTPKPHIKPHYEEPHHPDPYHPDPYHEPHHPNPYHPKHHPDPYHKPHYPEYHEPHHPYEDPYHLPEIHHDPYHKGHYPKPPVYKPPLEHPHDEHLHPHHVKDPAYGYHYHPKHYKVPDSSVSHLPPKLKSFLPVGFHSVYNGPGVPPKYPPVPLGEPPSYPPAPYLLGLNKTEKLEKIKIDDVSALKDALKKAGVGPGSKKKVYLVQENDGETHVQISLPVSELFEDDDEFEDRDSEALDLSNLARASFNTTPLTTQSTTSTTTTTTTIAGSDGQSAQLKFEMNDFWLQMQKLFKPGQILMADKGGVKLNNILISKEEEEEDDDEYEYEYEEEDIERSSEKGITMDLKSVQPSLDLRDLLKRPRPEVETIQQPVPIQEQINVLFAAKSPRRTTTTPSPFEKVPLSILNNIPTDQIFVPDFQFSHSPVVPDARPIADNVLIVTPQPQTTTTETTSSTQSQSEIVLESLRSTLGGLVNSVQGLNNTVIQAMKEKTEEIKKEDPSDQIRSLQVEIASLTKMVHDLRSEKKSKETQDFMSLLQQTHKMIQKSQEQRQPNFVVIQKSQEQNQPNFVTTPPPPITTTRWTTTTTTRRTTTTTTTTTTTGTTTLYNWFTSTPTTKPVAITTTTPAPIQTFQVVSGQSNQFSVDNGLFSNLNVANNLFGAIANQQNTNSINLESANDVEQQQEAFLRLTNGVNNQPIATTVSSGSVVSNEIFPATLVSSSMSVGSSQKLPPGSAGFGTVEAVDLGTVNIQVANNPTVQQQFQSLTVQDTLPNYGSSVSNTNVQVQTFNPGFNNENLPTYGNRPSPTPNPNFFPNTDNDLPNYVQQNANLLANQFNANNFQASSPLNGQALNNNNQAWKGANHHQVFLQSTNQLPNLNTQSQLTPTFSHSNERPVRFPGDASNRFDVYYNEDNIEDQSYYDLPYYNSANDPGEYQNYYPGNVAPSSQEYQNYLSPRTTASPNIIAELARYSKKNNLIHKTREMSSGYIQYPTSHEMEEPDKELIFYPSGQLILGQGDSNSGLGPQLRQYLAAQSSYQHQQAPHYVFARRKTPPAYEGKTELFDPLLEGDEIIERSDEGDSLEKKKSSETEEDKGLLPVIIRTAKDDLKLVGDVLKMAFSR